MSRNLFRPLLLPRFVWNPHPNHPDPAKIPALQLPPSCYNFLPGAVSFLQRSFCHSHSKSAAPPRNAPAPLQTKNTKFAVAWAASFFVSLRTSSLLAWLSKSVHASWRKKRNAISQVPDPSNGDNPSQNSVITEERETSTSVTSGTSTSTRVSGSRSDQSSSFSKRSLQGRPPQLSRSPTWPQISNASAETKPTHILLTLPVSFSSVSSSPLFAALFHGPCPTFSSPTAQKIFFTHGLVFSDDVTLFLRQRSCVPQHPFSNEIPQSFFTVFWNCSNNVNYFIPFDFLGFVLQKLILLKSFHNFNFQNFSTLTFR